ncbi:hypothetical protein J6590_057119 [Homalodisca vitripennis]|nr:hypothetical protein J6590_057119 [Homalodisca vitripennis]
MVNDLFPFASQNTTLDTRYELHGVRHTIHNVSGTKNTTRVTALFPCWYVRNLRDQQNTDVYAARLGQHSSAAPNDISTVARYLLAVANYSY